VKKNRAILRRCISCRETFDRINMLKITHEMDSGVFINHGFGRSAYICKTKNCIQNPKLKKSLQKALKTSFDNKFYEVFTIETQNYK
tara:strand:- start:2127 stop:2387 length:261 start_codon:yes stop_codon:yes gene_type:complete